MVDRAYIYALADPRTDDVRYIGKAVDPVKRWRFHMRDRRKHPRTQWTQSLKKKGLQPVLYVLEGPCVDWPEAECRWIVCYLAEGARLTNLTDGGDGVGTRGWWIGKEMSASHRQNMSESQKARYKRDGPRSPETRAKIGAGNAKSQKGLKRSPEHAEKLRVVLEKARAQRKFGPETRAKIAAATRARPVLVCDRCGKEIKGGVGNLRHHQASSKCSSSLKEDDA